MRRRKAPRTIHQRRMARLAATRRNANPGLVGRGADAINVFAQMMLHEMEDNAHKGDWLTDHHTGGKIASPVRRTDVDFIGDLLYHAAKLTLAVRSRSRAAIAEYAADVGNCAWFVAHAHDVLGVDNLVDGPVEYDPDLERDADEYDRVLDEAYAMARRWLATMADRPRWQQPDPPQRDRPEDLILPHAQARIEAALDKQFVGDIDPMF